MAESIAGLGLSQPDQLVALLLRGLRLSDSGRYEIGASDISVRAFPFPYRAAFAMSNDCDSQSLDAFHDWHSFVNGSKLTPYGDGLGLEVGDSFWIYGTGVEPTIFRGHPFDATPKEGPALETVVEFGRLGWFDTLHSFGNWPLRLAPAPSIDDPCVANRGQILRGLERLDALGLRPKVFTNHSHSPSNVGSFWGRYQKADDPAHALHCLSAYEDFGFKYFWIDNLLNFEKFGDELDYFDQETLRSALNAYNWAPWLRRTDDERNVLPVNLPANEAECAALLVNFFNKTYMPLPTRDGRSVLAFKRHRGLDQPVQSTFATQVTSANLDDLERRGGVAIIYQHFGVKGPLGRSPVISKPYRSRSVPPTLDAHSVACWQDIGRRFHDGRLFVATVSRLLEWLWVRDALRLSINRLHDKWVVELTELQCTVRGNREPTPEDLNGLALVAPSDAPTIEVTIRGSARPLQMQRRPDPARPGYDAIYAQWIGLEWPE